ncbi:hypothetical protein, partial [Cupriavidus sp. UYPR2.512]|uniref:hypothetical protein n=1 Tax=Cupriavidus sp. UYPR2.512 TaxID=1080187 RepID=UPI001E5F9832
TQAPDRERSWLEPPITSAEITTARTTNADDFIASRSGDSFFGYFLALGQKVTRRLRRRNSPR